MLCIRCEILLGYLWVELKIMGNEFITYNRSSFIRREQFCL